MEAIEIKNLTKDFGNGKGIFNINLSVHKGECFGLIGINGSGKSTIMRHLMVYLHAARGNAKFNPRFGDRADRIKENDCWHDAADIKKQVGYIPGEIAFPDCKSGMDFLELQADYMGLKNMDYATELTKKLRLDPTAKLKRMSKGMKQKTAIVQAFMCDSEILLFDEPTTGLDPLMQKIFTEIIKTEKKKGKTIFMSSHLFGEMEETCDRVAFLKDGHIIHILDMKTIRGNEKSKTYKIEFNSGQDYNKFVQEGFNITRTQDQYNQATILIADDKVDRLFKVLAGLDVKLLTHKPYSLEECFKDIYNDNNKKEIK
jgi:ABC-2 type transport system ATP-binding protein